MYRARDGANATRSTSAVRIIESTQRHQRVVSALPAQDAAADPFAGLDFDEARRIFTRRLSFLNALGRLSAEVFDLERLLGFVLDEFSRRCRRSNARCFSSRTTRRANWCPAPPGRAPGRCRTSR